MTVVFRGDAAAEPTAVARGTIRPDLVRMLRERFPGAKVIGLLAPTGWPLIQAWDACLEAGREPIILHYPTPKLSRAYWEEEIAHAASSTGVDVLLCDSEVAIPDGLRLPVILLGQLQPAPEDRVPAIPLRGSVLQMSSGTTGHRKGIRFSLDAIQRHVEAYNRALGLTAEDCVVSWLPLYHDMGFVAAFVMPRLLGCKLVLMDPMDWVAQPDSLWSAIEEHGGTVCYMPNFGFEVMAARGRPMPTVRRWISCSEPTRARTMARFRDAVGASPDSLANCWGMAENIFAIALSRGIKTRHVDGVEVVSCGAPISGVEVKAVDGEIFVRSPTSITEYLGFPLSLDQEGYYPSGDLGFILDDEVYLLGRKHDVLNVAGRKSLASDIDYAAAEVVPEAAGRIAAFSLPNSHLGTEVPTVLVEHPQFWAKERDSELKRRVSARIGIENASVVFVPPRFITKTSSGKVNRRTTKQNWLLRCARSDGAGEAKNVRGDLRDEILELFPWLDLERPVGEQIDSLGLVNLSLVMAKHGLGPGLRPTQAIAPLLTARDDQGDETAVLRIVSLCDANVLRPYCHGAIESFVDPLGRLAQFRHVCAPPPSILLNDLIFHDYFLCRVQRSDEALLGFRGAIAELKRASLIVVDEASTIFFPRAGKLVYPELDRDLRTDPEADLIAVRWARYSEEHHLLPRVLRRLPARDPALVNDEIARLGDYLGVPVVRVAYSTQDQDATRDWPVQGQAETFLDAAAGSLFSHPSFVAQFVQALEEAARLAPSRLSREGSFIDWADQPHWCSWPVNPGLIDFILERYGDCVVLGKPASVPILIRKAREREVKLRFRPDLHVPDDCDCVVMAGAWGRPETDKPIFQLMSAGWDPDPVANVPPEVAAYCPPARL